MSDLPTDVPRENPSPESVAPADQTKQHEPDSPRDNSPRDANLFPNGSHRSPEDYPSPNQATSPNNEGTSFDDANSSSSGSGPSTPPQLHNGSPRIVDASGGRVENEDGALDGTSPCPRMLTCAPVDIPSLSGSKASSSGRSLSRTSRPASHASGSPVSGSARVAFRPRSGQEVRSPTPLTRGARLGSRGFLTGTGMPLDSAKLPHGRRGRSDLANFVQEVKPHFGLVLTNGLPNNVVTVREAQQGMNNRRLRIMPHRASRSDRILHRADGLAEVVDEFMSSIRSPDPAVTECSTILFASLKHLTRLVSRRSNSVALEEAFIALDQVAVVLKHFTQHMHISSRVISDITIQALILLVKLDLEILKAVKDDANSSVTVTLGPLFEIHLKEFLQVEERFSLEVWRVAIERCSYECSKVTSIEIIREWLSGQTSTEQTTKFHGFYAMTYPETELPLRWLSGLTTKFWQSGNSMLFITGEAGCGKSAFVRSILDRSKARYSRGAKVLYFNVEPSRPGRRTSVDLVKSLLLQLFERNLGDPAFFNLLHDVCYNGGDEEEGLWSVLQKQAHTLNSKYPGEELLLVIDGLDKIEGDKVQLHTRLHEVVKGRRHHRCIIFSRPLFNGEYGPDHLHCEITSDVLKDDIHHLVRTRIQKIAWLRKDEGLIRPVTERALQCQLDSLVTAHLLVGLLEVQGNSRKAMLALQSIPSTSLGLIDMMIMRVNFEEPQVRNLMTWLLVSERVMTLSEIETMIDPQFAAGSLGLDASKFIQKSCASLIEIQKGVVQFIHPLIKERLLQLGRESTIPFSPRSAHQIALWHCLEYIKHRLPESPEIQLTLVEPDIQHQPILAHVANDRLLKYSILHYIKHYNECQWGTTSDFRRSYLDSPLLAQCESYYWKLHFDGALLEQRHSHALEFRQAVFGGRSLSIVQNLITLAMLNQSPEYRIRALASLQEAWGLAIKLLGRDARICWELALKYSELCRIGSGLEFGEHEPSVELFLFLWDVEQRKYGPMSEQAITQVNLLIAIYNSKDQHEQVIELQQYLYENSALEYGKYDDRTISYAEILVKELLTLGSYHEASMICIDLLQVVGNEINDWDYRQSEIFFHLIDCYESQGLQIQAQEMLRSSWETLASVEFATKSPEARSTFVRVTSRLGELLIEDGKRNDVGGIREGAKYSRACEIVIKLGEAVTNDKFVFDQDTLRELLTLSDYFICNEVFEPVIPILIKLKSIYCTGPILNDYAAASRINILLSKCYRRDRHQKDAKLSLEPLFRRFINMKILDKHCIDVATELVDINKELGINAMPICQEVLQIVWPDLLVRDWCRRAVPVENTESAIRMALLFASLHVTQRTLREAEDILWFLSTSLRHSKVKDIYLFETMDMYSDVLHRRGQVHQAIQVLQDLYSRSHESYGTCEQHNRISIKLVSLYQMTDIKNVSESFLIQLIDSFGQGERFNQSSCINAVLFLIKFYEAHGRSAEVRTWYEQTWNSVTLCYSTSDITEEQIFEALHGYSDFLLSRNQYEEAIQVNSDLRKLVTRGTTFAFVADYELAKCFEKAQNYHDAVDLYEEVCRNGDEISSAQEKIAEIVQCAADRLSFLYARDSNLTIKAEKMLRQRWETTKRIQGISHSKTVDCFQKITNFYCQEIHRADNSLTWMEEYIVQIMIEEDDETGLFNWATKISNAYRHIGAVEHGLKLVGDLRAARAFVCHSGNDFAQRIGQSRILLINRRSFILVNTLEKLLKPEPQPPVLHDIIQEVLTESALYEAWTNAKHMPVSLETRLAVSSRLKAFLQERGRVCEQEAVIEETLTLFQSCTRSGGSQSGPVRLFLEQWLGQLHKGNQSVLFIGSLAGISIDLNQKKHYADCLTFTKWAYDCLSLRSWGSQTKEIAGICFKLVRQILASDTETEDANQVELREIATKVLVALICPDSGGQINLVELGLKEINVVTQILVANSQLKDLEKIFQSLWEARVGLDDWHLGTTISIGLRLCKVKFARQQCDEAQDLVTDILYNLLDVYGEDAFNPVIIQCKNLYASFLRAEGEYSGAFEVHSELLGRAISQYSLPRENDDFGDRSATLLGMPESMSDIMSEQVRLLKTTYDLNGGWDDLGEHYYMPLLESSYELGVSSAKPELWQPIFQKTSTRASTPGEEFTAGYLLDGVEQPEDWTIHETPTEGAPVPVAQNPGSQAGEAQNYYNGNLM